jgi:hypothetical protein
MVAPVFVTVEAPRTAKVLAAPRLPAPVPKSGSGGGGVGEGAKQGADAHTAETLLASIVTAPLSAKVLPNTLALVFREMLASARIFPENSVFAPRVAELPTAHHTLVALAPPVTTTLASPPVTSVLPIWKIQIESALPLRVSVPVVTAADVGKQWTPGGSVSPPSSATAPWAKLHTRPWRSRYVTAASAWAWAATTPPACMLPPVTSPAPSDTVPGGTFTSTLLEVLKPVSAVPGLTPTSPVMAVGPELVTVEAPRTAKLPAVSRFGAV